MGCRDHGGPGEWEREAEESQGRGQMRDTRLLAFGMEGGARSQGTWAASGSQKSQADGFFSLSLRRERGLD